MTQYTKPLDNQQGAVLITGLFTLALLSFLGAAATTTSRTDISMVGNHKVIQESFYNAEFALAQAEMYLDDIADYSAFEDTPSAGYYAQGEQPSWYEFNWDHTDSIPAVLDASLHAQVSANMAKPPRFAIEERAFFRDSLVQGKPPTGKYHFNITALGVGSSPKTISVLGSILSKRFN